MAFILQTTNPNFAESRVHGVLRLETEGGLFGARVNSFATVEAYMHAMLNPHSQMVNWQDFHPVPVAAAGDPQAWLIGPDGPFAGATVLIETTPLTQAQSIKWAEIKARRDHLETAGFEYLGRPIDSDSRSVQRIALAVQAAQAAVAAGEPFGVDWTCADNTVLPLDGAQMMGMPVALAQHANALHEIARGLRELIYAEDATSESVAAVTWPI